MKENYSLKQILRKFGRDIELKESMSISKSEKDKGLIDLINAYENEIKEYFKV